MEKCPSVLGSRDLRTTRHEEPGEIWLCVNLRVLFRDFFDVGVQEYSGALVRFDDFINRSLEAFTLFSQNGSYCLPNTIEYTDFCNLLPGISSANHYWYH